MSTEEEILGADFEQALLTAIVERKEIRTAIKNKITSEYFFSTQGKAVYQYLLKWYQNPEYSDTPSWESLENAFPSFEAYPVDDSTRALCDQVREKKLYSDLSAVLQEVASSIAASPILGFEEMKKQVSRLQAEHTVDDTSDVRNQVGLIRSNYMEMKARPDRLKGRAYPWPKLNECTLGCQDGHLVIIYARPKSGKTWLLLKMLQSFHASGARPIVFSQELTDIEIAERYVAMALGLDFNRMQRGDLEQQEERDFYENLEAFQENEPVIISSLTTTGEDIVMEMTSKIEEYGANVAGVDGVYFLGADTREIVGATRGMKKVAKSKRIPVLGTTQRLRPVGKAKSNSYGSNGDDVYGSDSYLQDSDLLLLMERGVEQMRNREAIISVAAIRNGQPGRFSIHMDLCKNMEQKQVLRLSDEDDEEEAMRAADDGKDAAKEAEKVME